MAAAPEKSGLLKKGSVLNLQHIFVTHMPDAGSGVRNVQVLPGNKDIRTTMIFSHTGQPLVERKNIDLTSPLLP
jgi:site-specific recombinase XerD